MECKRRFCVPCGGIDSSSPYPKQHQRMLSSTFDLQKLLTLCSNRHQLHENKASSLFTPVYIGPKIVPIPPGRLVQRLPSARADFRASARSRVGVAGPAAPFPHCLRRRPPYKQGPQVSSRQVLVPGRYVALRLHLSLGVLCGFVESRLAQTVSPCPLFWGSGFLSASG